MAVEELNSENFAAAVADGVAVVDFWAPWCAPCRALSPILEELAEELGDKVKFCKMNVDDGQEAAQKYGVMSIPAVFIFKDGEVAEQFVGLKPKSAIAEIINRHI